MLRPLRAIECTAFRISSKYHGAFRESDCQCGCGAAGERRSEHSYLACGALWIACAEFLDRVDPIPETATHYRIGGADGKTYPVRNISQDHTGMLWPATSRGIYRLKPSTGETIRYRHDPNNACSPSS